MLIPRIGMWVVQGDKLGIVAKERGSAQLWFHAVHDATGATYLIEPLCAAWRQARHDEIPRARRPSTGIARKLGYA